MITKINSKNVRRHKLSYILIIDHEIIIKIFNLLN
jgi:hypothetical protein